jgi:hypothetical protein
LLSLSQHNNWGSVSQSARSVSHIIRDLGYLKVCGRWAPQGLKVEHKNDRKAISSKLLAHFEAEGETFLSGTVTADESWFNCFEAKKKGNPQNGTILNLPR